MSCSHRGPKPVRNMGPNCPPVACGAASIVAGCRSFCYCRSVVARQRLGLSPAARGAGSGGASDWFEKSASERLAMAAQLPFPAPRPAELVQRRASGQMMAVCLTACWQREFTAMQVGPRLDRSAAMQRTIRETPRIHARRSSFNDPIGALQHQRGNRQGQFSGGRQIDDQFDHGRLLHRKLGR